jgi:hypothetical protein
MNNVFQVMNRLRKTLVNNQQIIVKQETVQLNLLIKMHENIRTGFKMIGIRLIRGFENEISIKQAQIIANLSQKVDKIGMRIQEVKKDLNNSMETRFDRLFLFLIKSRNEGLVGLLNIFTRNYKWE